MTEKNRKNHTDKKPVMWHFPGKGSFTTGLFGSYRGNPLMPERTAGYDEGTAFQDNGES